MSKSAPSLNQAVYARIRSAARTRSICRDYARYEAAKAEWSCCHPDATPEQYDQAMRAIAKACGV